MTSEDVLSLVSATLRVHLAGSATDWILKLVLCPTVPALRGVCCKRSQTVGDFCHLNLGVLLGLEKSHSSIACLVSQISGSVTRATILTAWAMKCLCFLMGMNFMDHGGCIICVLLGHLLGP